MNRKIEISDEEFLKVLSNHTYAEACKILKCSFSYCWNRGKALGIKRTPGRKKGSAGIQFKQQD